MEPFFTPRHKGSGSDHSPLSKKEVGMSAAHPPHLSPSSLNARYMFPICVFLPVLTIYRILSGSFSMFTHFYVIPCPSLLQIAFSSGPAVLNRPFDFDEDLPFLDTVRASWNQHLLINSNRAPYKAKTDSMILNLGCLLPHTVFLRWSAAVNIQHLVNNKVIGHMLLLSNHYSYLPCLIPLYYWLK